MILPSDNWCVQRYFMMEFDNQGTKVKVPDYKTAFREDIEIGQVIAKIGSLFADRGFPLKDAEQEIKNIEINNAETSVIIGKKTGASITESPLDKLNNRAKADIIIQVWWKVNKSENGKSISFTLEAFDTYTRKLIASSTGTGNPNKDDIVPVLLQNAILAQIEPFINQLQQYFNDMYTKGREIVLSIMRWENWDKHFNDEIQGDDITSIINDWMKSNCMNGRFNLIEASENSIRFEQVKIPIYDNNNIAIDARQFAIGLQKYLKKILNVDIKISTKGLGESTLIIGEN